MNYPHLSKKAITLINESDEIRINSIRSPRWIGYESANQAIKKISELMEHPKIHRMPNLLIVSESNNGKTAILNRFKNLNLDDDPGISDFPKLSVFYMECPPLPDERRFLAEILSQLKIPMRKHERSDNMLRQVRHFFEGMETKILLFDEIQHIVAGPLQKQRVLLNTIKYLGNQLQIPIVVAGVREAFNAFNSDPQLSNRFPPYALPRWQMSKDYLRLLKSFESSFPLKKASNLHDQLIAGKILSLSEGLIGEISSLLVSAAVKAVETGDEMISVELIDKLNWVAPSQRRSHASAIM